MKRMPSAKSVFASVVVKYVIARRIWQTTEGNVMNKTNIMNVPQSQRQMVEIGTDEKMRYIEFVGTELCYINNKKEDDPRHWDEWTLYQVKDGYRVWYGFHTVW